MDGLNNYMTLSVLKLNRVVIRALDAYLLPGCGLTANQFFVLKAIDSHPQEGIKFIADKLLLDRTTVTRGLNILMRDNLVTFRNIRAVRCFLITTAGAFSLQRASEIVDGFEAKISYLWTEANMGVLEHLLENASDARLVKMLSPVEQFKKSVVHFFPMVKVTNFNQGGAS